MDRSPPPTRTPWADPADQPISHPAPAFATFADASALDTATIAAFLARVDATTPVAPAVHPLAEAGPAVALPRVAAGSDDLLDRRRSARLFAPEPLGGAELGAVLGGVLGSVRPDGSGRRSWPSAGGLAAVQVHVVATALAEPWGPGVHRFVPGEHGLARVGGRPDDDEVRRLFSIVDDVPPALVVLGVLPGPTLARYGERGGRFLLIEVGAAAQVLSLRAAEAGLAAYLLGGLIDRSVAELLGAAGTDYRPVVALAVGHPAGADASGRRRRRRWGGR